MAVHVAGAEHLAELLARVGEDLTEGVGGGGHVVRVDEVEPGATHPRFGRVPEHVGELPTALEHLDVGVEERDGVGDVLEELAPLVLGGGQGPPGVLPVGHVERERQDQRRVAVVVEEHAGRRDDVDRGPVLAHRGEGDVGERPAAEEHLEALERSGHLVGGQERDQLPDGLVGRPAEEQLGGVVPGVHPARGVDGVDGDRGLVEGDAAQSDVDRGGHGRRPGRRRFLGLACEVADQRVDLGIEHLPPPRDVAADCTGT